MGKWVAVGGSIAFGLLVAVIVYSIGQIQSDWEVRH